MKFGHVSAYSFGKSYKGQLDKTDRLYTPGPGAYTPSSNTVRRSNPHWKIGTEPRSKSTNKSGIPGPGQYSTNTSIGVAPKYTMASKSGGVDMSKYIVSPGPGNYSPNFQTMYKSFSYSMSGRPNSSKSDYIPGPGNYNIRSEKSMQVPSYKFGTDKRDALLSPESKYVPGPGNYNTTDQAGKSAPKFSFGKEERGDRGRPLTPGPGQYQSRSYVGKEGPRITVSSRPQTSTGRDFVPGPGQYTANMNNRTKSPSYRIGSAKRDGFKFSYDNPGPGQYTPNGLANRPKSPNWSMGTGLRANMTPNELIPGPGNYNTSRGLGDGPKFTITGKNYYTGPKLGVPGPGQYNNDTMSHLIKNPTWRIGTSTRDDNLKKSIRENFPGPGNYSLKPDKSMPSFRFGTEKRGAQLKNDTPGPGQYRIPCSMVDVPTFFRSSGGFDSSYKYI